MKCFHLFSMPFTIRWGLVATVLLLCGGFIYSHPVQAAQFSTTPVSLSGSGTLTMQPGEVKEVQVIFQNTGEATWRNDGPGYISLYTHGPKYRKSAFDPGTWLGPNQLKRIIEPVVLPGQTASMRFELHAPQTPGVYTEVFHLASEDTAWIASGNIQFTIHVANEVKEIVQGDSDDSGFSAELELVSATRIKARAGTPILLTAVFKNTGTRSWTSYSLNKMDVALASTQEDFTHPSWSNGKLASATEIIAPGHVAHLTFALSAPRTNGTHTAKFQFYANGERIEDVFVELPVEVTGGAEPAKEDTTSISYHEDEEPMLRVGLLTVDEETDNEIVITSFESDFDLRDTQGNLLAQLRAGEEVTVAYVGGRYVFDRGRGQEYSSYGLRFEPARENAVMTITNFDYRLTRNGRHAFNTYRNILEVRHNDYKDRTWVINELSIESYLKGLAETSNISPSEYQKALVTAARTYAYYHFHHGTKRGKEFMHVIAYADDQVYRGYGHEQLSPRIVQAVLDTRGMIVTYNDALAITPYFSRSDGRTRNWSEVWGGSIPWCQGVSVPWEAGGTLWGHGIGLSALGALRMANDGYVWDDILKYFYTGIEVQQWWE